MRKEKKLLFAGLMIICMFVFTGCGKQKEITIQDGYVKTVFTVDEKATVKEALEDFVTSADGHIFLSDYEEGGCISKEDFKENLSQEAQFTFQDGLTEVFYDKNPELYEMAFAIFEEAQMNGGEGAGICRIYGETFQLLYHEFLDRLFDEKIAK